LERALCQYHPITLKIYSFILIQLLLFCSATAATTGGHIEVRLLEELDLSGGHWHNAWTAPWLGDEVASPACPTWMLLRTCWSRHSIEGPTRRG